ncbi:MAG: amino acid ABC transporter substrate-binding protein [Candidatus Epulonipiscioides saccharophilum]|nr:MAG: amino acid ABC transporter substrate-binding protein [Epulopiscium sp. AS2M-Bin001]
MKLAKIIMSLSIMTLCIGCSKVEDEKTFTVGFDASYPPYGYMNEQGEYIGFDLELAQLVCDSLGYELIKQPIDWASKDMELNSGNIDCIWNGFSITPDRLDKYAWSEAYVDNLQVIVVPKNSSITELKDLEGKNVVVQAASAAYEALVSDELKDLTGSFADLSENPDYNTAFMNMDAGAADAIAIDIGVAVYQLASRDNEYRILEEHFQSEKYGIGFRVGDEALRDEIDAELMKLVEDGTYYELGEKYGIDINMLCLGK